MLILGAGAGNDVAAALRHGAQHVDAVELDPIILRLGRQFHPENPYKSPNVTAHVNDARAFLKTTRNKYDLVVFAFLDSTTLLSGFSSLRLDNYVYTVESFGNARDVLSADGTLVLSFATGRNFATDRLYKSVAKAFGVEPAAYFTRYWVNGVLLVEGQGRTTIIPELFNAGPELQTKQNVILATDHWPFLYLAEIARFQLPSLWSARYFCWRHGLFCEGCRARMRVLMGLVDRKLGNGGTEDPFHALEE